MTTEARSVENRTRLVSHFDKFKDRDEQTAGWSSLWESDESGLWDRGRPSPAFVDFLETTPYGRSLVENASQLKAFVPGCGKGHDVAMLALHGFSSYGLELSPTAVNAASTNVSAQLVESSPYNFGDDAKRPVLGEASILMGDFFQQDWDQELGKESKGFDLIYDYTFLCALLPSMRRDWARRIASLLSPTGVLICLEFPMWKPLKAPGPPWGLNGVHWNILAEGGNGIVDEGGKLNVGTGEHGSFERVEYWKPPKSFEQGRGEDMISVWKLKKEA